MGMHSIVWSCLRVIQVLSLLNEHNICKISIQLLNYWQTIPLCFFGNWKFSPSPQRKLWKYQNELSPHPQQKLDPIFPWGQGNTVPQPPNHLPVRRHFLLDMQVDCSEEYRVFLLRILWDANSVCQDGFRAGNLFTGTDLVSFTITRWLDPSYMSKFCVPKILRNTLF